MKNLRKNKNKKAVKIKINTMNQTQYNYFLTYWGLGGERSLEKLRQHYTVIYPKIRVPCVETLKNWSRKFSWQMELIKMDEDANKKLYEEAIGSAREARVDIMKLFKAVVLRFATQLKNDPYKPITSFDIANFWRMARIEMGLPADSVKQTHELGDSFFEIMRLRHDKRIQQNPENRLSAPGQGDAVDSE